jgi:hypothetical protein
MASNSCGGKSASLYWIKVNLKNNIKLGIYLLKFRIINLLFMKLGIQFMNFSSSQSLLYISYEKRWVSGRGWKSVESWFGDKGVTLLFFYI